MNKQFYYINIIVLLCIIVFTSCEKMPDVVLPSVVTNEVTNIQDNEAVLNATFTFDEKRSFKARRAFEISDTEEALSSHQYYYDDDWTAEDGYWKTLTGSTTISASINSLSPGTTYYCRAVLFPKNTAYSKPIYGNVVSFKTTGTQVRPSVTIMTEKVESVTSTTAKVYAKCSASNVTIIDVGILISRAQKPTIDNNSGISSFKKYSELFRTFWHALSPATKYFVRAYAKDSDDKYYYGEVLTFTTKTEPGGPLTVGDFVGTYTVNAYSPWEKKNITWNNVQFKIHNGDTIYASGWDNNSKYEAFGVFDKGLQVLRFESSWYYEDLSFAYGDSTVYALFTPVWYNSSDNLAYHIESGGKSTYGEIWLKKTSTNNYEFVSCDGDSDDGYYANGFIFIYESRNYFSICGNSNVYTNVKMTRTSTTNNNVRRYAPISNYQIMKQQKKQHHETEYNYTPIAD